MATQTIFGNNGSLIKSLLLGTPGNVGEKQNDSNQLQTTLWYGGQPMLDEEEGLGNQADCSI